VVRQNRQPAIESDEDLIPLSEAAILLPTRRKPHVATLWRWGTKGCRGHLLKTWVIAGRRYTSPAALQEFLTDMSTGRTALPSVLSAREAAIEAAEADCDSAGIR